MKDIDKITFIGKIVSNRRITIRKKYYDELRLDEDEPVQVTIEKVIK